MTMTRSDARATIERLINHAPDCNTDAYRPDDDHDIALTDIRTMLIAAPFTSDADINECTGNDRYTMRDALLFLMNDEYSTQYISELALSLSLCPMHLIDYAICFDDENDDCRAIRDLFPDHDT